MNKQAMNKKTLAAGALALVMSHFNAQAADNGALKKGGLVSGGAVIGAVAAGPIGFLVGAGLGIWINEETDLANKATEQEITLAHKQEYLHRMEQQLRTEREQLQALEAGYQAQQQELLNMSQTLDSYQHWAMQHLQFDIKFRTDNSQLEEPASKKLAQLARFINQHPQLVVSLEGYADPRGSSEYNQKLSNYRVQSVMNALLEAGVDPERIQPSAFGASESQAKIGDLDAYAFERRVSIEIFESGLALAE